MLLRCAGLSASAGLSCLVLQNSEVQILGLFKFVTIDK